MVYGPLGLLVLSVQSFITTRIPRDNVPCFYMQNHTCCLKSLNLLGSRALNHKAEIQFISLSWHHFRRHHQGSLEFTALNCPAQNQLENKLTGSEIHKTFLLIYTKIPKSQTRLELKESLLSLPFYCLLLSLSKQSWNFF